MRIYAISILLIILPLLINYSFCPYNMIQINNYCIDKYEAPNIEGEYPLYAQSAYDAISYCREHGKTLCTHQQWKTACIGPNNKSYPYGYTYKKGICNDNHIDYLIVPWKKLFTPDWMIISKRLFKGTKSGSKNLCKSDYGVYDLTGNVAEWVVEPKSTYGYVVKGGFWHGVSSGYPSCHYVNAAHNPNFNSYEFGFRCCLNL